MRTLRAWLSRLAGVLGKKRPDSDLAAELESHIAMQAEENQRHGLSHPEARRQAIIRLGSLEQAKEIYRNQQSLPVLENLFQDVRYGLRMLRANPGFTLVAALTLALGIGVNTAMFSIVNGVLLRPLPYEDPARLISVFNTSPARGFDNFPASPPDVRQLRALNHTLISLSGLYYATFNVTGGDKPERVLAGVVTSEYFTTLGIKPMLGRAFLTKEETWGAHHVMVVSYGFWRSHLNSDPNFSGKTFNLDGEPYQVVGVMPASFYTNAAKSELWVPMSWKPKDNMDSHNNYFLSMIARLRPGVTEAQSASDLNSIMLGIARQFPENKDIGVGVVRLDESWLGGSRRPLLVLLGAVGLVLLIACVNLVNLLLARATGRQKEIGIRSALGASRGRLLRQLMTESLLFAVIGGSFGLALAYFSLDLLPLAGNVLPRIEQVQVDGRVLLFTAAAAILTAVLVGLMPALQSSHGGKLNDALKEGGRTSQAGGGRLRSGLVISEVTLAFVLLMGSGLAIRSLQKLLKVDAGFSARRVLTFNFSLPDAYDPKPDPARIGAPPAVGALFHDVLDRIEHLPGVKAAGITSSLPFNGENWTKFFVALDRPIPSSIDKLDHTQYRAVYGRYFDSLGIRLVKGRFLDEHDQTNTTPSVVVNETLADKYWPQENPIGKIILLSEPENLMPPELIPPGAHVPQFTVVGVVSDVHYSGLDQKPEPVVYASVLQNDFSMTPSFTVRTDGDPIHLVSSIRSVIAQCDKNLPLADVLTMDEIRSTSVAQPRLEAVLLGLFGGLAMLLAAVGIYGVMSYSVSQRTSEIGVRIALGADRGDVLAMVCKQGLRLAGIGLASGVLLALAVTRVMSKVLFGISPTDPGTFAAIIALLALVALFACYVPARRATKVDPMVALRHE
ncbi:MAG TPA: ABC transporter permease [Terriglobales bacterium]